MSKRKILPHFALIAVSETHYFPRTIQKQAKAIEGVYMIDLNTHVHIGSLVPMQEAQFLYSVYEAGHEDEKLVALMDEADNKTDPFSYFVAKNIDQVVVYRNDTTTQKEWDAAEGGTDEEKYRNLWEEAVEDFNCNRCYG